VRTASALLLLITLLLLLPLAEVVVRIVRPQSLPSQEYLRSFVLEGMYVNDDEAGYRLTPNFQGEIRRGDVVTTFHTNAHGLRAEEIGPKTKTRVLVFGDSFTWGWGVPQDEVWTAWAQREVDELTRAETIEVINCGVNGYGTENELRLLEKLGPRLDPDLVLVGFFANDYTDNLLGAKGMYSIRNGFLFDHFTHEYFRENFLARESHLWRLLTRAWELVRIKWLGGVPTARPVRSFSNAEFEKGAALSAQHLLAMRAACEKLGARFAVIWLPADVYAVAERTPEIPLRRHLQQRIAAAGIPSLDLLPIVRREPDAPGLYLPNDGHFSVRGNRVAGRAVGRWLVESRLVAVETAGNR
jgi:lysophospholipase L1-like esterase